MHRKSVLSGLALTFTTAALALAQAQPQAITFESTELAPGLHMLEGKGGFAGGNLGLLVGEDGVLLIDDGLPPLIDEIQAAIDEITTEPVELLINTHVHGDHIGGNEALAKDGALIVAHDNLRQRLAADGMRTATGMAPAPEDALPVVTFSDSVTFHVNDRSAFVFHVSEAHTDGDAVIHFREDNVIHAGDVMFNGMFPFIDLDSGGSVDGYIAAQKEILALTDGATRIIAGHGPLAGRDDLQKAIAMLEDARAQVGALVEAGKTADEVVEANPLAAYEDWSWMFITTERMTRTIYRDLSGD